MSEPKRSSRTRFTELTSDVAGAVIVVSNECATGQAAPSAGERAIADLAKFRIICQEVTSVAEDLDAVRSAVNDAIAAGARFVLTCGGTGVTKGDVVPEACEPLIKQRLWGIETQILLRGLENTPLAGLSRGMVGICGDAVIVNAPGSRGGVKDAISVVAPLFPNLLEQLDNTD